MQHCSTVQQVCSSILFPNTYIPTAALSIVALELCTYSVKIDSKEQMLHKDLGDILVGVCYVPGQV